MGYWVHLCDKNGEDVTVNPFSEGGVVCLNRDSTDASVSVTYNYGALFREAGLPDGMRSLQGKTGAETLQMLKAGAAYLGTRRSADYWEATPGTAGVILALLASWAEAYPDAVWQVN